jgi:capsular polysaccharide biosynthesis protein
VERWFQPSGRHHKLQTLNQSQSDPTAVVRLAQRFLSKPRFVATPDYAARTGEAWKEAFPPRRIGPDTAVRYGRTADFLSKLDPVVPTVGVIESRTLHVAGVDGLVCAPDGTILADHSWFRTHVGQMKAPSGAHEVRRLPGRAVTLASTWANVNYGHFILDVLPRLAILERLGIDVREFDHVICGAPSDFCLSLLERLGVDLSRVVCPQARIALKPDVLVAPTLPGARRAVQPWSIDFFRRCLPQEPQQARRLYIVRHRRKPANEVALIDILRPHGFEIYKPEEDAQRQARTFAEAEAVVGPEGSAMANLMFCRPGTHVLELLGSDHVMPYYFSVAMAGGLRYACMVGESTRRRRLNSFGPSPYDFHVDEAVFEQAVGDLV